MFTLSDDRLDGFNRFGSHMPGLGIGVGWQLSKYWNICWGLIDSVSIGYVGAPIGDL